MKLDNLGDIAVGDTVYHVKPDKSWHGNRTSDQSKGTVVRIAMRSWGPSLLIKHEGRIAPIEWSPDFWRKEP